MESPDESHDIIIIGAGLTGINTAHRLKTELPHRSFTILEARSVIGGTWSFWKYPGFRSDSSLRTFGLRWHTWEHSHKVAQGHEIVEYLEEASRKDGSYDKIQFDHTVTSCEWSSETQKWTLEVDADGTSKVVEANFLIGCTGYYSYEQALDSPIPGLENFTGQVVHPQWWPEDLDYSNERVVVIGSGATAITILPLIAETAESCVMLQRSPSYVASMPNVSGFENFLRLFLPLAWVHIIGWWLDTWYEVFISEIFLRYPGLARKLVNMEMKGLMPKKIDMDVHFNPRYGPFEQRLCLTPDGEFFKALDRDNCEIVTDVIDTVTEDEIVLKSGRTLPADIIVTATGLHVQLFGGLIPLVDGEPIDFGSQFTWRGCFIEDVPNLAFVMGYVTSSWTPGADAMARTVIQVIKKMETKGATSVVPGLERTEDMTEKAAVDATSTYFVKAADRIPKATDKGPFYGRKNLILDTWVLMFGNFEDGMSYKGCEVAKSA